MKSSIKVKLCQINIQYRSYSCPGIHNHNSEPKPADMLFFEQLTSFLTHKPKTYSETLPALGKAFLSSELSRINRGIKDNAENMPDEVTEDIRSYALFYEPEPNPGRDQT